MRSVEWSIEHLQRNHFPILYIHDPTLDHFDRVMGREPGEPGTLAALRKLKEQGVVDNIGVGINNPRINEVFIETGEFDCALVPEAYSLLNQYGLRRIFPAAERYDMGIATAEALEKGFLALGVRPNVVHRDRNFSPECLAHTREDSGPLRAIRYQPGGGGDSVPGPAPPGPHDNRRCQDARAGASERAGGPRGDSRGFLDRASAAHSPLGPWKRR